MSMDTPSIDIFNGLNYLQGAKNSGADIGTIFPELVEKTGILIANQVRRGKIGEDALESVQAYILLSKSDKYFSHKHVGLESAFQGFVESINVALLKQEQQSHTVPNYLNYELGFKRL